MSKKTSETAKTDEEGEEGGQEREELGDVGPVVRLPLLGPDPFVGRHGHVPAVEGHQRQHVEQAEGDVDHDQERQQRTGSPRAAACTPRFPTPIIETGRSEVVGLSAAWAAPLEFVTWWKMELTRWARTRAPGPRTPRVVACPRLTAASPKARSGLTDGGGRLLEDADEPLRPLVAGRGQLGPPASTPRPSFGVTTMLRTPAVALDAEGDRRADRVRDDVVHASLGSASDRPSTDDDGVAGLEPGLLGRRLGHPVPVLERADCDVVGGHPEREARRSGPGRTR